MLWGESDNFQWLADLCAQADGVVSELMWGDELVFRTGEVMFCLFRLEGKRKVSVAFRVTPDNREAVLAHPDVQAATYPADGEWVFVTEETTVPRLELSDWIRNSYELARSLAADAA